MPKRVKERVLVTTPETRFRYRHTIKGSSRRAEKSRKVLMMMKASKLGWAGAGAGKKQGWTKSRARKGRSRAVAGQK